MRILHCTSLFVEGSEHDGLGPHLSWTIPRSRSVRRRGVQSYTNESHIQSWKGRTCIRPENSHNSSFNYPFATVKISECTGKRLYLLSFPAQEVCRKRKCLQASVVHCQKVECYISFVLLLLM